jgi:molybdopterin synthase sulfur carrier subunit
VTMQILYFANLRETLGKSSETLDLTSTDIKTVADLIAHQRARGEDYSIAFENTLMLRVAVNQVHAQPEHPVSDTDEVAFFPPVTGG